LTILEEPLVTLPRCKNVGATLVGLILVGATASPSEGQTTGRLQVTARVLDVRSQQAALSQAWVALGPLLEGKDVLETRPGDGLMLLTVRRPERVAGPQPPESVTASLVYIAN
jgi:hypothetical protein